MKKLITLTLVALFASSLGFAQRGSMPPPEDGEGQRPPHMMGQDTRPDMDREDFREKREEMKKDRQEMEALVEKYNSEKSSKKKAAIEEQVKAKVSANYDKHLERMSERVKGSEDRLEDAKKKLDESKKPENKEKHVTEMTKKILSGEKPAVFGPPNGDRKAEGEKSDGKGKRGDSSKEAKNK